MTMDYNRLDDKDEFFSTPVDDAAYFDLIVAREHCMRQASIYEKCGVTTMVSGYLKEAHELTIRIAGFRRVDLP